MDILLATQEILLYPFQLARSRTAQRAYLSTVLLGLGSLSLLGLAVLSYGILYMNYVPKIGIEKIIHLQYPGAAGESSSVFLDYPTGMAFLEDSIHANQRYDISIFLHVPTSPNNYELGNFMIDMELWTQDSKFTYNTNPKGSLVARSSRPAILTYQSPLAYTMKLLLKAPLLMLGLSKEAENVKLKVMEDVEFDKDGKQPIGRRKDTLQVANGIPGLIKVKVLARRIQVYEAKVTFRAKLRGIRWLMYNYRITSFILFATTFWMMEMFSAFLVWYFVLNSLTKAWIPEKPREKKYVRDNELRGTVSDLDLESEFEEEEYTEEGEEEAGDPREEGIRKVTRRELGYPSPAVTPGLEAFGEVTGEELKNATDYADDEGDEGSDETGEIVERPPSVDAHSEAGMAADSGVGSSLSEAGASGEQVATSMARVGLGGKPSALQRRTGRGEGGE